MKRRKTIKRQARSRKKKKQLKTRQDFTKQDKAKKQTNKRTPQKTRQGLNQQKYQTEQTSCHIIYILDKLMINIQSISHQ